MADLDASVVVISSSASASSAPSTPEREARESGSKSASGRGNADANADGKLDDEDEPKHLVLVAKGKRREEYRFVIAGTGVVLGRGKLLPERGPADKKLTIPDPEVSRKHLRLWVADAAEVSGEKEAKKDESTDTAPRWQAEDLGSLNGSTLNGREFSQKDSPQTVRVGDILGVGSWTFVIDKCGCKTCSEGGTSPAPETQPQAPRLDRCLACAQDFSGKSLAAQNAHLKSCLAANPSSENRAQDANVQATARKRRIPSGGRAPREKRVYPPGSTATRPSTARKQVKPLLLTGSLPSSMIDVRRRLDLVDARIHELQMYRSRLADYLVEAQALQDALQDSGSDTAAESNESAEAQPADVSIVAALSRPLPNLVLSPSSSSSFSPSCSPVPNVHRPAPGASHLDTLPATTGAETMRKAPGKSRVSMVVLDDDDEDNDEEEEEEEGEGMDQEKKTDSRTSASLWTVTSQCASTAGGPSPTRFRTSLLSAVAKSPRACGPAFLPSSTSSSSLSDLELATIPSGDLRRALKEAGVPMATSRKDMESEVRQVLERAKNVSNVSAATDATVSQANLEGLTGAAREQALNLAICQAISQSLRNERLYENMLMNKCVHLSAVQAALKESGITVARARLAHFLDHHGVIFKQ
ncbi:Hypothetical Protein FCC1311_030062 [Hondaea fermentalgiana]|uniref:Structure-specific endonuclease subunit SLX4 n=1 Tax=Hondaea fermentalgiana TaxID=2315210 RepID=A0A2R5GG04_9STRA|nr:Hypothetical Protein FCC1311_030062 [Hondaea fermentalgiana]|eukprot:GBG26784.1 Hypothetical Protein FCC1311_030062 [Hondaea fermentalgiana]